jgi:diguanylate cyclase (GGDEF)-like protein
VTTGLRHAWRFSEGRVGPLLIAALCAVAAVGIVEPGVPLPRLALIVPISHFVAVLGDGATAIVLFAIWRSSSTRRSTFVLALSFAASGVLALLATLVLPLLPDDPPVLDLPVQTGIWLYFFWHVAAAVGALAYVFMRRAGESRPPSPRFVLLALATAIAAVGVSALVAFAYGSHLTVLGDQHSFTGLVPPGVGPFTAVLLAVAALFAFAIRQPNAIDRALALSLVALALDVTLLFVGGLPYTSSFYAGRLLLVLGATFVFVSAVRSLVGSRIRLGNVESTLHHVESESAGRAGRIRALWQISSDSAEPENGLFSGTLRTAATALRPGKSMHGHLSHIVGGSVVIDATSRLPSESGSPYDLIYPGATFPIERMMANFLRDSKSVLAWNDLSFLRGRGMLAEELGLGCFIGAMRTITGRLYFLTFMCTGTMADEPFAEDDVAYVDVVASFFASRFAQQAQFEQIKFQVEHDALTGLQNRLQFRQATREAIRGGKEFTLAILNLDGFRHVNEREGVEMGDEVLVEVAADLESVAPDNIVARMGGDEFAIVLRDRGTVAAAATGLKQYADIFRGASGTSVRRGAHRLGVGASIGAARFPADGTSNEELIRRARVALEVAKTRGGSTTMIFDRPMERILESAHLRIVELTSAIANDEFALLYQPTFVLATRKVVGAEALIRWNHPQRGLVPPVEFVTFAERQGLIGPLSRWVFRRLVRDLTSGVLLPPGFRVYFNLAAEMLDDVPFIAELLEELRAWPGLIDHVGIEVTETTAMQNVERSMHTIALLRGWGFAVAIDDFGTGYSSLSYLKRLTVDLIKIDRSFIIGLPDDEQDGALTEMLLRITDRFGFATVAEGIETEAQAAWLLAHGCRLGQGYLVAKPGPFADLVQHLDAPVLA